MEPQKMTKVKAILRSKNIARGITGLHLTLYYSLSS